MVATVFQAIACQELEVNDIEINGEIEVQDSLTDVGSGTVTITNVLPAGVTSTIGKWLKVLRKSDARAFYIPMFAST